MGSTSTSSNTIFYCDLEFDNNIEGESDKHTAETTVSVVMGEIHVPYGAVLLISD